jgi:hypothetical protein
MTTAPLLTGGRKGASPIGAEGTGEGVIATANVAAVDPTANATTTAANDFTGKLEKLFMASSNDEPQFYSFFTSRHSEISDAGDGEEETPQRRRQIRAAESATVLTPYRGPVEGEMGAIMGGVRSMMTTIGATTLKEGFMCTTFVRVSARTYDVYGAG